MERHFEIALREVKQQLLGMAGLVERSIAIATDALQSREAGKFGLVYEIEEKVNQSHVAVDDACLKLLAQQQPFAKDLRLILAIIKINTDLERMGDQAVNIAQNSEFYLREAPLKPLVDLPEMSREVRLMVRDSLDAFVQADLELARAVLKRDDQVDFLKAKIFRDVVVHMKARPDAIEQGLSLILIARNLERIGDHSTNIAEDIIFAVTGRDVRHTGGKI